MKYIRVDDNFQKMFQKCKQNMQEVLLNLYGVDIKEEYLQPAIIFVGVNIGGGVEQSTFRFLEQLMDYPTFEKVKFIHFYEQGLPQTLIEDIALSFLNVYDIQLFVLNEQPFRYIYTLYKIQKIKQFNQIGRKINIINIFQALPIEFQENNQQNAMCFNGLNFDLRSLILSFQPSQQVFLTPVFNTYLRLARFLKNHESNIPLLKIDFIQSGVNDQELKPFQERKYKLLIQKRLTHENFEPIYHLVKMIIDAFPEFEKQMQIIKFQKQGEEFYKEFLKHFPKQEIINEAPEKQVKYIFNDTQFVVHQTKNELFSITQIDAMQNQQVPVFLPVEKSDFGKYYQTLGFGIFPEFHESKTQIIEKLGKFLQLPDEQKNEYIYRMRRQILEKYNSENFLKQFSKQLRQVI